MKTSQIVEELVRIKIEHEKRSYFTALSRVESLIEKLCASREGRSKSAPAKSHNSNCALEMDPDYYGPCTCHKYSNQGPDYDL